MVNKCRKIWHIWPETKEPLADVQIINQIYFFEFISLFLFLRVQSISQN